jgi:hypothetical protein
MDKREQLKSMLHNMINDNPEQASLDLHNYLTTKMREVSGLAAPAVAPTDAPVPTPESDDTNAENNVANDVE